MLIIYLLFVLLMVFLVIIAIKENLSLYQEVFRLEAEIKEKEDEIFKKELYLRMIKQDKKIKEIFSE